MTPVIIQRIIWCNCNWYWLKSSQNDDSSEEKNCKRVKKKYVKQDLTFVDYKNCVWNSILKEVSMNVIRSRKPTIFTETIAKNAFSAKNEKNHWSQLTKQCSRQCSGQYGKFAVLLSNEVSWDFTARTLKNMVYKRFL